MNREIVPPKDPLAQTIWKLLFNVQVSINRTVQAQTLILNRKTGSVQRSGPYALLLSGDAAGHVAERLLVPATNILDRTETRQRFAASVPPEEHLREFVLEFSQIISAELGVRKAIVPSVNMGTLEVCWDFYDKQPVIAVEVIKAKVMRIAKNLSAKYASTATMTEGLRIDSPSVMIFLIDGLAVRFYAKSFETVRFEVVYGPKRIKCFKPRAGIQTLAEAIQTAREIRHDAASHMNTILRLMHQEIEDFENEATPDELIRAVLAAFPNVFEAKNILACLARHGRVRAYPKDPRLPGFRKLKSMFVLENDPDSPGARNYVATQRYEDARRRLMFTRAIPRRLWIKPRPRHLR